MTLRDLVALQEEFERAFREARAWRRARPAGPTFEALSDVSRGSEAYHVRVDLPGVKREHLRVQTQPGALSIRARRDGPAPHRGAALRAERKWGHVSRLIALPSDADWRQVRATLKDGVLHVRIPRLATTETDTVDVVVESG